MKIWSCQKIPHLASIYLHLFSSLALLWYGIVYCFRLLGLLAQFAVLFILPFALLETLILLTSSFTCGLAMLATRKNNKNQVLMWFGITCLLGLAFIGLEVSEFSKLTTEGNSWQKSAFLSSYFTLVGT